MLGCFRHLEKEMFMSNENFIEEENNDFIKTPEFDSIFNRLISQVPVDNHREAASVIYGNYKNWTSSKTIKHYNLSEDSYNEYAELFGFKERGENTMAGRKSKQDTIVSFLTSNVGKVVTPVEVASGVEISLPTFYNFYNANRGYFRKVKRGHFEIIDPKQERANS
jgi:hypothetical protein